MLPNQFLEYALKYAELGWRIFPCAPRQKVPITAHGVKDATVDVAQIQAWWAKWPNANVAVACGKISGVYVLDVDVTEAGDVNGYESLKEFPPLTWTAWQRTPRGGFHAFFHTTNPPANRNSFRPGIDIRGDGYYVVVAPSIHPNGGEYAWETNCAPWECQLAEFPDSMRPTTRSPWTSPQPQPSGPRVAANADVLRRASLYLAQCDPAIQGCAGHDKLFWAAGAMTWGCGLSADQAIDILTREYNPRCVPPWDLSLPKDSKDFQRKVHESIKKPPDKPHLWILNDPAYAPVELVSKGDIIKLIADSKQRIHGKKITATCYDEFTTLSPSTNKELEFLCRPPGLVGDICQYINATAMSPQPFLTLACVLAFCGVLFGRKVRDSLDTRTNLYCLGIADSSHGKNHAPKQIRKIAHFAGCGALIGGDDTASDTAIEECLERSPATLCMWDEIGFLLSYIRSGASQHHTRIIPQLMKLWSSAGSVFRGKMYADQDNQRTIIQPCFSLYGTSTFRRFTPGITPEQLDDGWLARCLVFRTYEKPRKKREGMDAPVPRGIQELVSTWYARQIGEKSSTDISTFAIYNEATGESIEQPPQQIIIPREPEAEKLFVAFDDESCAFGKKNPTVATLWLKGEENARRVALILAAGENYDNPQITTSIADYACRLIRYLLLSFGEEIAPTITTGQIDSQKQKILELVKKEGIRGCPNRLVVQRIRNTTKKQRDALLMDLVEAQELAVQQKKGKTAPTYWTAENYVLWLQQNDS